MKEAQTNFKAEMKQAREIAKYGRDYDMSQVIKWVFILFAMLMGGLFCLEVLVRFVVKGAEGTAVEGYLTPEIVHTIFGFVGGWGSAIVTYFFAKKLAEQIEQKRQENGTQNQKQ